MEQLLKFEIRDEDGKVVGVYILPPEWAPDPETPQELDSIVYLVPSFELGASSADPSLGTGGALAWYTKDIYKNGTCINLHIYLSNVGGDAGVGTGSYELYLPDEIEPAKDLYSGHANLWVAGGGVSEFDGSVKWTFRNTEKGPKLIFTFNGQEWGPKNPKFYADFKLRASIEYYL